jgi:hypothetical protein
MSCAIDHHKAVQDNRVTTFAPIGQPLDDSRSAIPETETISAQPRVHS